MGRGWVWGRGWGRGWGGEEYTKRLSIPKYSPVPMEVALLDITLWGGGGRGRGTGIDTMSLPIFLITKLPSWSKWLNRKSSMTTNRELPSKLGWSGLVCERTTRNKVQVNKFSTETMQTHATIWLQQLPK